MNNKNNDIELWKKSIGMKFNGATSIQANRPVRKPV